MTNLSPVTFIEKIILMKLAAFLKIFNVMGESFHFVEKNALQSDAKSPGRHEPTRGTRAM